MTQSGLRRAQSLKNLFGKPPNDSNLADHLSSGGPSVKNVYGAHSEHAFKNELASINGVQVGQPTSIGPGILEYSYNTPERIAAGKPPLTKTTYDSTYTDVQILDLSKRASSQVWTEIQKTGVVPKDPVFVMVDGVPFKVNPSVSNGNFSLYAHPGVK